MPRWSNKPPLEPEVSPSLPGLGLDWDAEVLGGVNLWQFAVLAGLLVVFCGLLVYWQRRANTWGLGPPGGHLDPTLEPQGCRHASQDPNFQDLGSK